MSLLTEGIVLSSTQKVYFENCKVETWVKIINSNRRYIYIYDTTLFKMHSSSDQLSRLDIDAWIYYLGDELLRAEAL